MVRKLSEGGYLMRKEPATFFGETDPVTLPRGAKSNARLDLRALLALTLG